jgi:hypothetical protein
MALDCIIGFYCVLDHVNVGVSFSTSTVGTYGSGGDHSNGIPYWFNIEQAYYERHIISGILGNRYYIEVSLASWREYNISKSNQHNKTAIFSGIIKNKQIINSTILRWREQYM